jgi:hypothetical protein
MAGSSGSFQADGDGQEYNYRFEKWKEEQSDWKDSIEDSDLPKVDAIVFEIENVDTKEISYETISSEADDWDFYEQVLEQDWGGEGSR